jgi:predicted nucleic acid-binding protein
MKALLDSSVLVAVFYGDHEHHPASFELFLSLQRGQACCAAHSLAEVYSVLTGMPGKERVSGDEAMLFLGSVRERLSVVTLNEEEYWQALEWSAGLGVSGGGVYDAASAQCFLKAGAEALYTWNEKHFKRLGVKVAERVRTP